MDILWDVIDNQNLVQAVQNLWYVLNASASEIAFNEG